MVKLLHTADIHLDGDFRFMGEQGERHRRTIQATFDAIVDLAHRDAYHLLLIAGDLFDSPRPSQRTVEHVKQKLASLRIPVCILPGNHDALEPHSVFMRETFPPNVTVMRNKPTYCHFDEYDLVVGGVPCTDSSSSALAGLTRPDRGRWFVAMAHGNLETGLVDPASRPLRRAELAALRADYVALGDWHGMQDCLIPNSRVYYAGAPEPTTRSQTGTGRVLCVTLDDKGVAVEPVAVGTVSTREYVLDVTNLDYPQLLANLRGQADARVMLNVRLSGLRRMEQIIDMADLQAQIGSACYAFRVDDQSALAAGPLNLDDFPESQVIGQFVRLMFDRIGQVEDPAARRTQEQALQVGVALLQGKEVLR